MGNFRSKNLGNCDPGEIVTMSKTFTPVEEFEFHDILEDSNNGLFLNNIYFPEEVLFKILSYVPPKQLLSLTLVCKKWCNIIKSDSLWMDIYNNEFPHKAKRLPWYIYYSYYTTDNFKNLLKNGNGQEEFLHWKIIKNFGDQFVIENPPAGCDPLPEDIPDFNGYKSCFATSYYECDKLQEIKLENKRLIRYIMNKHSPHIYASEWVAGRFDCGCKYRLTFKGFPSEQQRRSIEDTDEDEYDEEEDAIFEDQKRVCIQQWEGKEWQKVEIIIPEYEKNVMKFVFEHEGADTQFWKGHYGSKMAGGVVKLLFDTIKPEEDITDSQTNL